MTPNEWTERYEITSVRGRIWTRAMIRTGVLGLARILGLPVDREILESVLGDDAFMRFRRGMIPTRVIDDVHTESRLRATSNGAR